jgi:tRNA pseudouridine32 synthase/23S rRNA pseudouridine746 synthase
MLSDRILFIDAEAIVLDKPAGLPVDAPRRGGDSITAKIDELRCGFQRPPVAMHRLDTDTSGCLLFARTAKARSIFQRAFETRAVEKYYVAIVAAEIAEDEGVIDVPLAKTSSAEAGWKMIADRHGPEAITRWRRIAVRDGATLVEFRPLTGRTHQIRAHAREAFGRGIAGDRVYGVPGGPMLLHASRLVVPRERKPTIDVTAPLPE